MDLLLPATKLAVRASRACFTASRHIDGAVRGLVYERPPIEPKEVANHVEASFEVGRNGAWRCPRDLRGRRHGGRLGHHPGRTGVEPVYRRRDGLGRRGRRDRLGSGRLPARRNTRWRRSCVTPGKNRPRLPPPPPSRNQKRRSSVRDSRRRKRPRRQRRRRRSPKRRPLSRRRSRSPRPLLRRRSRSKKPRRPRPTRRAAPSLERSTATKSGDITYVMFSDGAVEVRTSNGAQRFASLAELRAQAAQQY